MTTHSTGAASKLAPRLFPGSITDIAGLSVGHFTDTRRPTGCTVLLCEHGATAGVDVRGAAPGTRETDLLDPRNVIEQVHAVLLTGGSAFGLAAADGVMRWLEERGHGQPIGPPTPAALPGQPTPTPAALPGQPTPTPAALPGQPPPTPAALSGQPPPAAGSGRQPLRIPIVPAAVLFDLWVGDPSIRPDAAAGHAACELASTQPPAQGSVGAGAGATVGKLFGVQRSMKGGIGTASMKVGAITVGALVAVNAIGDVVDPASGRVIAGALGMGGLDSAEGRTPINSLSAICSGQIPEHLMAGMATTIGIVATDARLTKAQASKLAAMAHDGLARSINPAHTLHDGDTLFALATGGSGHAGHMTVLGTMAAEVTARAVLNAVRAAQGLTQPRIASAQELGLD